MEDTGGTTSTMCEITPSDLAGMVDNLVSRVIKLEQTVSQLLGVNVEANQLSDISEDLGWITGVTYLGEEGWTQTPSGTLIPPTGWTGLSSIIDGQSGFYNGGAYGVNFKHVYTTAYAGSDISGNDYLHAGTSYGGGMNTGDAGLTAGSIGGGTETGWLPDEDAYYMVFAYASVVNGTSAPSNGNGYFQLELLWMGTSSPGNITTFAENQVTYPGDGLGGETAVINVVGGIDLPLTKGLLCRFVNATDGDLRVTNLNVIFWKVKAS